MKKFNLTINKLLVYISYHEEPKDLLNKDIIKKNRKNRKKYFRVVG